MKSWKTIVVVGLFLVFTLGLAGFTDGPPTLIAEPESGPPECTSCSGKDVPQPRWPCPFTITIECWCEIPDIYVCCTFQHCSQPYAWARCTSCFFYDECYWQDCDDDPPEKIATWPDNRELL